MHAQLLDIRVRFGPLVAVDGVSVDITAGKVLAVVGENGAGKSTLANVLFGLIRPDAGRIEIDGTERRWSSPRDAIKAGLGMVHQHFMLQEQMTVLENIVLGSEPVRCLGIVDFKAARGKIEQGFRQHGIVIDLDARAGSLSVGEKQVVEILKVLSRDASMLILDEPTAVLTPFEKDRLFALLRSFAARGKTVVIITHKLDEVIEIADNICVMRRGKLVSSLPIKETSKERIAREIIGGELPSPLKPALRQPGEAVLEVRGLRIPRHASEIGPLSFEVRAGEIVGIAGVSGNGQAELVQGLTGLRPVSAGTILIAGKRVDRLDVRGRRRAGMSYIPQDRQAVGLALGATVTENANAGRNPRSFAKGVLLDRRAMLRYAKGLIERYRITVRGPDAPASGLSGGNQQKLVAGRELSHEAPLLIAENPTWGIDIGAIALIHAELMRLRDRGHAVLLVSAELDEVLRLSDRILVMYSGLLSGPVAAAVADRDRIGALMTSRPADAGSAA